jgi:hypothetical protein
MLTAADMIRIGVNAADLEPYIEHAEGCVSAVTCATYRQHCKRRIFSRAS